MQLYCTGTCIHAVITMYTCCDNHVYMLCVVLFTLAVLCRRRDSCRGVWPGSRLSWRRRSSRLKLPRWVGLEEEGSRSRVDEEGIRLCLLLGGWGPGRWSWRRRWGQDCSWVGGAGGGGGVKTVAGWVGLEEEVGSRLPVGRWSWRRRWGQDCQWVGGAGGGGGVKTASGWVELEEEVGSRLPVGGWSWRRRWGQDCSWVGVAGGGGGVKTVVGWVGLEEEVGSRL